MPRFRFETQNSVELMRLFLPGTQGFFSTRHGGVSAAPYDTLNLALHVGDVPEAVVANRRVFADAGGFSLDKLVCAQQVHGTSIFVASSRDRGRGVYRYEDAIPDTDALITNDRDVVLGAFFADCVSVYIADPVRKSIGLAHAGWKGTVNGIAGKTMAKMTEEFGSIPAHCFAFIGPSIGPCCYRVGEEVVSLLDQAMAVHVSPESGGQNGFKLDLWSANRDNLVAAGMTADNILVCGICTQCDTRFFSYRREGEKTGRMAGILGLS